MKTFVLVFCALLMSGCAGGGSSLIAATAGPLAASANVQAFSGNTLPTPNGQPFTLAQCVPIYNDSGPAPYPNVGTACGGISPTGSNANAYTLNNNPAVPCFQIVQIASVTDPGFIVAFQCHGKP